MKAITEERSCRPEAIRVHCARGETARPSPQGTGSTQCAYTTTGLRLPTYPASIAQGTHPRDRSRIESSDRAIRSRRGSSSRIAPPGRNSCPYPAHPGSAQSPPSLLHTPMPRPGLRTGGPAARPVTEPRSHRAAGLRIRWQRVPHRCGGCREIRVGHGYGVHLLDGKASRCLRKGSS